MGRASLEGMLDTVDESTALRWHLECNHYPSVGFMFDTAKAALDAMRDGEPDTMVLMPPEMVQRRVPAWKVVEGLHLEAFLEEGEEE